MSTPESAQEWAARNMAEIEAMSDEEVEAELERRGQTLEEATYEGVRAESAEVVRQEQGRWIHDATMAALDEPETPQAREIREVCAYHEARLNWRLQLLFEEHCAAYPLRKAGVPGPHVSLRSRHIEGFVPQRVQRRRAGSRR